MKEISKKLLLITALTAGCAAPMHGAQYKHFARKAATAASWLGAWGIYSYLTATSPIKQMLGSIRDAKHHFNLTQFEDLEKASPLITDFVHDIMKREGIAAPESVHVYIEPSDDFTAWAYQNKNFRSITIESGWAEWFATTLKSGNTPSFCSAKGEVWKPSAEEYLDLFRATLSHEAGHIKHGHRKKKIIAGIAIPATFLAAPLLKPNYAFGYRSGLIALGAISYIIPNLLLAKFSRICETQADDAISVPSEMAFMAKFYRLTSSQPPKDIFGYIESLDHTHPSNLEGADRLEHRLQRLQEGE